MNSARRLCMVVHGPYPIGEPRVHREAQAARAAGWDVDVVALRRPGEPSAELLDGVSVFRLPIEHRRGSGVLGTLTEYASFTALASILVATRHVRRRYAVVQVHNPPDFLLASAAFPRALGARTILDVHDLSSDMFMMRFGQRSGARVAERLLRLLERWAGKAADAVLTVHEPYRQELVARGLRPDRIAVVMNTLDESLLPEDPEPPASAGPGFRVVYHGTVTPSYGVELLVRATASVSGEIPDLLVEIHGEGDAVESVRSLAGELGVSGRVAVGGTYLPHAEVLRAVQGAAVGVIPNLPTPLNRFALSSKLFEYVTLGIPVVCADLPTLRAHFSDVELSFFRAGDAESLARALVDVASDRGHAARRAAAARMRYEEYRWPRQAERYTEVLAALSDRRAWGA
jgi:glycosyltransferase involved in cell wall biosynthesis